MIHAYASIWWCMMHDIIIEIREKACVHVHLENKHTSAEMETIVSLRVFPVPQKRVILPVIASNVH